MIEKFPKSSNFRSPNSDQLSVISYQLRAVSCHWRSHCIFLATSVCLRLEVTGYWSLSLSGLFSLKINLNSGKLVESLKRLTSSATKQISSCILPRNSLWIFAFRPFHKLLAIGFVLFDRRLVNS